MSAFRSLLAATLTVALVFLIIPVLAIFLNTSPGRLLGSLGDASSRDALVLSLEATTLALVIILLVGTPAAYWLATRRFRGRSLVLTAVELPLVLPPAVAGIALLAAFGPKGIFGDALAGAGVELVLQRAGVVVALVFVAAPFYLRQAVAAFEAVPRSVLAASRTLGVAEGATLARVAVPAALPGLAAGAALAWGRALGEFGATLMFAGSFRGSTQTAPLAIYDRFADDFDGALALSAVLVCISAALLVSVKLAGGSDGVAVS